MIPIEITSDAVQYILDLISEQKRKNVILSLVQESNDVYQYRWTFTDSALTQEGDIGIRLSDDHILYMNKFTIDHMYASAILMAKDGSSMKLVIVNPQAEYKCVYREKVDVV